MTEELEQLLGSLHLRRILDIYDGHLKASEKEDVSYTDFFGAGRYNLINDRDFVAANLKFSF